jgi:hypothetical protein
MSKQRKNNNEFAAFDNIVGGDEEFSAFDEVVKKKEQPSSDLPSQEVEEVSVSVGEIGLPTVRGDITAEQGKIEIPKVLQPISDYKEADFGELNPMAMYGDFQRNESILADVNEKINKYEQAQSQITTSSEMAGRGIGGADLSKYLAGLKNQRQRLMRTQKGLSSKILTPLIKESQQLYLNEDGTVKDGFYSSNVYGLKTPNIKAINELAKNMVRDESLRVKFAEELQQDIDFNINVNQEELNKVALEKIESQMPKIKEQRDQEFEKQYGDILAKDLSKATHQLDEVSTKLKGEYEQESATINQEINAITEQYKSIEQQINSAQYTSQEEVDIANQELKKAYSDYQKSYSEAIDKNSELLTQYNARINNEVAKLQEAYQGKVNQMASEFEEKNPISKEIIDKAYGEALAEQMAKAKKAKQFVVSQGGIPLRFGTSTLSSFGTFVEMVGATFGGDGETGKKMQQYFQPTIDPIKGFKDLTVNSLTESAGNLVGSMLPSITASMATAVATKNLSASARIMSTALAGFSTETADLMGRSYREALKRSGSVEEAQNAAKQTFDSQLLIAPTYVLDALPFVGGIKGISNPVLRFGANGALEYSSETFLQEYPQTLFETAIAETGDATRAGEFASLESLEKTAANTLPVFLMGGGIAQTAPTAATPTPDQFLQKIEKVLRAKGETGVARLLSELHLSGSITKDEMESLSAVASAIDINNSEEYNAIKYRRDLTYLAKENESDAAKIKIMDKQIKAYDSMLEAMLEGKNVKTQKVKIGGDEFFKVTDNPIQKLEQDEKVQQEETLQDQENVNQEEINQEEQLRQEEQTIVADEKASIKEPVLEEPQDGGVQKEGGQESAELRSEEESSIEKIARVSEVKAKNIRGLYDINRKMFGQDKAKSLAGAVVMDRAIGQMAKRDGVSKSDMYSKIKFKKAEKAPDGSLKQEAPIFKSTAQEGIGKIQQKAATPEQWVKMISDKGGKGTTQELEWIGLQDFLNNYKKENNLKSVPKEVVEQFINDNQIEIVEVEKSDTAKMQWKDDGYGILQTQNFGYEIRPEYGKFELYRGMGLIGTFNTVEEAKEKAIEFENKEAANKVGGVKYQNYQLEGGENYREVLLTLPQEKPASEYKSSHWDESNILAHLRINERTLPNGERVMFIEEVQSDWAQEGKKKGFASDLFKGNFRNFVEKEKGLRLNEQELLAEFNNNKGNLKKEFLERTDRSKTPDMPYKKTDQWVGMAMRRAMQMAAQEGFDRVAWVTGEQSADRYDLSKQVDYIDYWKNDNGTYGFATSVELTKPSELTAKELEGYVGKEIAERIVNDTSNPTESNPSRLEGQDLKVGGEGMKAFYNSILPKVTKKEAQRFDKNAKVEVVDFRGLSKEQRAKNYERVLEYNNAVIKRNNLQEKLGIDKPTEAQRKEIIDASENVDKLSRLLPSKAEIRRDGFAEYEETSANPTQQLSIPITPKMRMNLNSAVPLFQGEQGAMLAEDGNYIIYALTDPNVSTPLHELAHVYEHYLTDAERVQILNWAKKNKWDTSVSEKFARGFEKYLASGKAPTSTLQKIFDRFKEWLTEIYNGIKGSEIDIELNDKMRSIYDSMLSEEASSEQAQIEEGKKIDLDESTKDWIPRGINKGLESIRRNIQDRWFRLKKTQKLAKQAGKILDDATDAYTQKELQTGKISSKISNFKDRIIRSKPNQKPALLENMQKDKVNLDEFGLYLYAMHAPERNATLKQRALEEGREGNIDGLSGMTDEQASDILSSIPEKQRKTFEKYAKDFKEQVINPTLDELLESRLIDQEQYDGYKNTWENYVPLMVKEFSKETIPSSKFSVKGKDIYRAKGSNFYTADKRENPFISGVERYIRAAGRAEENKTFQSLVALAERINDPDIMQVYRPQYEAVRDSDGNVRYVRRKFENEQGRNLVEGKIDGKPVLIEVKDKALYDSMENSSLPLENLGRVLGAVNSYLRAVNTLINPEFIVRNFIRDIQTATLNISAEDAKNMATKMLKNIPSAVKGIAQNQRGTKSEWADLYQELKDEGGDVSWLEATDINKIKSEIEGSINRYDKSNTRKNLVAAAESIGSAWSILAKSTEMGTRLAAYKAALDSGYTKQQAASLAKNLTVNFEKKGFYGNVLNSFYLFSNAGIQGTAVIFRALTRKGVGGNRARRLAASIVGASFLNAMINDMVDEDDEYEKLTDVDKERNMIFMLPDGDRITIPLPYGYNILWSMGQLAYEYGSEQKKGGEALATGLRAIDGAFNPLSSPDLGQMLTPTIAKPFVQMSTNKNWKGDPIKPLDYPFSGKLKESSKYFKSVRPTSKAITDWLNSVSGGTEVVSGDIDFSPEFIDHFIDFLSGGVGRFGINSFNILKDVVNDEDIQPNNIPFSRIFYRVPRESRDVSILYETIKEAYRKDFTTKQKDIFYKSLDSALEEGKISEEKYYTLLDDFERAEEIKKYSKENPDLTLEDLKERF